VQWQLRTPQGLFGIRPVMPDQELDSRQSTGTVYWEGLCALHRLDTPDQPRVAWGYLEMTGYGQAIEL
jgi:predicted secreted hydrolase